ncbi:MAG: NDP-sugar synthase [Candidatus Helarchaeota archaeon]|nr:NDP-sugar synthase [Candidatus Helarchaeota archaeon]
MRAVILAAGYGKRMGELTKYLPKSLIPVVNKPVLEHLIEIIKGCGIKEVIIAVGHLKDQITSFLTKFNKNGINLIVKVATEFSRGPIHSFSACLDEIEDEEFILIPADFLIEHSQLSKFLQMSEDHEMVLAFDEQEIKPSHTTIYVSENDGVYRVVGINSNVIGVKSEEKMLLPLLICRTNIQSFIRSSLELKKTKVIDAVQLYLQQKNVVVAFKIKTGTWFDLDTIKDFLAANEWYLTKFVKNQQQALNMKEYFSQEIVFKAPILLGNNCQIKKNCTIGPNVSIGDETIIGRNSKIQNAIIGPRSEISSDTEIKNAIFFKSLFQ